MKTPAERHAQSLLTAYGWAKTCEIVRDKLADAPFLANGDRNFWIAVREAAGIEA